MSCIRVLLKVPSMSCTTHAYTHGLRQNTMTFKKSCHTEGKRCHFNSTVQVKSCTIQHQSAWKTLGPPWQPVVTHGHPWPMAGGRDPGRPSVPSPSAVAPPWSDSSHPSASATPEPTGPLYVWLHHWTCKKSGNQWSTKKIRAGCMIQFGSVSKPCTPGEPQNSW